MEDREKIKLVLKIKDFGKKTHARYLVSGEISFKILEEFENLRNLRNFISNNEKIFSQYGIYLDEYKNLFFDGLLIEFRSENLNQL